MNPLAIRSFLIHLHIRQWTAEVNDKRALKIVADKTNADTRQDKYRKSLFVTDPLMMIQRIAGRIRLHFYRFTLPWADGGGRVMPSVKFQEFSIGHKKLVADFEEEVAKFIAAYDDYKEEAKEKRGDLYNEAEYPPAISLWDRFEITLITLPFPTVTDFRVEASEAVIEELKEDMSESIRQVQANVDQKVTEQINTRIDVALDSLLADKRITQPNIDELAHAISFVESLGDVISESTKIMAKRITDKVLCYTAAEIRNSDSLRKQLIGVLRDVQQT